MVRICKADGDGELYGPGKSATRRSYFAQELLGLFAPEPHHLRFVILWEYSQELGLTLSLACPKNWRRERSWQKAECHFYVEFPHAATTLAADDSFSSAVAEDEIRLLPKFKAAEIGDDELGPEDDDKW